MTYSAWISPDSEVSSAVNAERALPEFALHDGLEPVDIAVLLDERRDVAGLCPFHRGVDGDVAAQTARVVV